MRARRPWAQWLFGAGMALTAAGVSAKAAAAPKRGEGLQTNSLSVLLVNRDLTTQKTTSIKDTLNLSGVVGLHYYFVDRVRFGMSLQFTERLWPAPQPDESRWQRFALMPQLGWSFADPFYTALIFSYAPRTLGRSIADMSLIGALGAALPVSRRVKISLAVEVPYAFWYHRTVGLVALTGVSFRL